jgi:DNA-binding NarL/FixJ family response regulator
MKPTSVLIADDHAVFRIGLSTLLGTEPGFTVVGEAEDGAQAVALTQSLKPDVVIMDIMMPEMDGIEATRKIKDLGYGTKILILTTSTASEELQGTLSAGADGALLKNAANGELLQIIRDIADGRQVVSKEIESIIEDKPQMPALTSRQQEILYCVKDGLTNKAIARTLNISADTVNEHLHAEVVRPHAADFYRI